MIGPSALKETVENKKQNLFTIGYEGADLKDFVLTLKNLGVTCLADIRQLPISRRKGFAKTALSQALESEGIRYAHFRSLGDPKEGRDAAKAGNYRLFVTIFTRHMQTEIAQDGLRQLEAIVGQEVVCLMCYEYDHKSCHRSIVARMISGRVPINLRHVSVRSGIGQKFKFDRNFL